jgi:hypothetical protein
MAIAPDKTFVNNTDPIFVPFSEELLAQVGMLGELVPFQLEYHCLHLKDGTYEFGFLETGHPQDDEAQAA